MQKFQWLFVASNGFRTDTVDAVAIAQAIERQGCDRKALAPSFIRKLAVSHYVLDKYFLRLFFIEANQSIRCGGIAIQLICVSSIIVVRHSECLVLKH